MEIVRFSAQNYHENGELWGLCAPDGVSELATSYLRWMTSQSTLATGTATTYAESIKLFAEYLANHPLFRQFPSTDQRLAHVNRLTVQEWLGIQAQAGIQRSTRCVRESAVRSFYQFLSSDQGGHVVTDHPYSRISKLITLPQLKGRRFALTESMIQGILLGFHNESERALWHFAYDVGIRIGEAPKICKAAIDASFRYYNKADRDGYAIRYVPILLPTIKKGGDEPINMLSLVSVPALMRVVRYHQSDEYDFSPGVASSAAEKPAFLTPNGLPWKYHNARKQLINACLRADVALPKRVTPHIFRHSSATAILSSADHGADHVSRYLSMSVQLRHANPHASEVYAHISADLLSGISQNDTVYRRSERLFKATYLSPRKHIERRGHKYHDR